MQPMETMAQALLGVLFIAAVIGALFWWNSTLTEGQKWDLAARAMAEEGYSDIEIELAIGPRPKD